MCYLLGFNSKEKVNNKKYLDLFFDLPPTQKKHFDGHGYYIKKESNFILNKSLDNYQCIESDTVFKNGIFHIREADFGSVCLKNNHPFIKNFNTNDLIFAHNGNLKTINELNLSFENFIPEGTTDSEMSFCYFLESLKDKNNNSELFDNLYEHCNDFSKIGNHNILFTYDDYLFGYCTSSLFYLEKEKGFIISTKPLTDEGWVKINKNEAVLIKNGTFVKTFMLQC